jgi:CubicO group peptidase (beta-lactamase class C family)
MRRRVIIIAAGIALAAAPAAAAAFRLDLAIRAGTGFAARSLCSQVFVTGRLAQAVFEETVRGVAPPVLTVPMTYRIDPQSGQVEVRWASVFRSLAVYRGEAGCMVWRKPGPPPPPPRKLPPLAGPETEALVTPADPALAAALDHIFAEPARGPRRNVKAVVVMHDGRSVAERYAPGVGIDTPLPGFSLSKTATAALIGVLVRQGRLRLDDPIAAPEWAPGDPRQAIRVSHLLRMTSGLAAEESHTGFDFTTWMLYLAPDLAAYAAAAPLRRPPGTVFEYQSPDTLLLSRRIRDLAGGQEGDALSFARRELFAPIGMRHAVLQTDAAGTPVGSEGLFASARDWARLGQLYLDDGKAGGRRLLPEGFVAWSAAPTLGSPYGAGLWTNGSDDPRPQARLTRAGLPADAFYGSGFLGQRIIVVPSQRLVVARLAISAQPGGDLAADVQLVSEVIAALRRAPAAE